MLVSSLSLVKYELKKKQFSKQNKKGVKDTKKWNCYFLNGSIKENSPHIIEMLRAKTSPP